MTAATTATARTGDMRESIDKAARVFAARPDLAIKDNPPATARLADGLRFEITGPSGERAVSDMPSAIGGADSAPVPGWYLRASLAACTATSIQMHAVRRGIALTELTVSVHSRSDARGVLGFDGISAALTDLSLKVRIAASNATDEALGELVRTGDACSPIGCTLRASAPYEVVVTIAGDAAPA